MKRYLIELFYCCFLVLACVGISGAMDFEPDGYGGNTFRIYAEDLTNIQYGSVTPEGYEVERYGYNRVTAFETPAVPVFHADGFVSVSMVIKVRWVGFLYRFEGDNEVINFRIKMAIRDRDGNVRNVYDHYYSGLMDFQSVDYISEDGSMHFLFKTDGFVDQDFFWGDKEIYEGDEITLSIGRVEAGTSFTIKEISIHTWPTN